MTGGYDNSTVLPQQVKGKGNHTIRGLPGKEVGKGKS